MAANFVLTMPQLLQEVLGHHIATLIKPSGTLGHCGLIVMSNGNAFEAEGSRALFRQQIEEYDCIFCTSTCTNLTAGLVYPSFLDSVGLGSQPLVWGRSYCPL